MLTLSSPLFLAVATSFALEPTPPPIVNGTPTKDWPAVGTLFVDDGTYSYLLCTGTLIAHDWVLTAAHCLTGGTGGKTLGFCTGTDFMGTEMECTLAKRYVIHPENADAPLGFEDEYDLALVELEHPFDKVVPMTVNTALLPYTIEGEVVTYVGFGTTADTGGVYGLKRQLSLPVDDLSPGAVYTYQPGSNLCYGDSGSPMIRTTADGPIVIGVASSVYGTDSATWCEQGGAYATRTDIAWDWIAEYVDILPQDDTGVSDSGLVDSGLLDSGAPVQDTADSASQSDGRGDAASKGCGCASGGSGATSWAWLGLAAIWVGRRRR